MAIEKKTVFDNKKLPYLLLVPELLLVLIFFLWPASKAVLQSLFIEDAFGTSHIFVGLENFVSIFRDEVYLRAVWNSVVFGFWVAGSSMAVALFLAALANNVGRGSLFYRTVIIWPYAVAPLVAGVMWFFLFNPSVGVIAYVIKKLGGHWNYYIRGDQAFFLVVFSAAWKQVSYNVLFFFAGMQNIPKSLMESASIDGATPTRRFWRITFPLLTPTMFFLLTMNTTYAFFSTFPIVHKLTEGGPSHATNTMVYNVYQVGFLGLDFGNSAAQSVILMVFVIALSSLQFRYMERKVVY